MTAQWQLASLGRSPRPAYYLRGLLSSPILLNGRRNTPQTARPSPLSYPIRKGFGTQCSRLSRNRERFISSRQIRSALMLRSGPPSTNVRTTLSGYGCPSSCQKRRELSLASLWDNPACHG